MKQFHTPCTHSCVLVIKNVPAKILFQDLFQDIKCCLDHCLKLISKFQIVCNKRTTYTCTFYFWSREKCELAKPICRSCIGQNVFKGSNQWSAIVQNPYPDGRYYFDLDLRTSTSDLRKTKRSSLFHEHKWFFTIR